MTKKQLRRRIAVLEMELTMHRTETPTFQLVRVILGSTGGGPQAIEFPVLSSYKVKPLDLPSLGYKVMWLGEPINN